MSDKDQTPAGPQKPLQRSRTCPYCGGLIGLARWEAGAVTCAPCDDLPASDPEMTEYWQKGNDDG